MLTIDYNGGINDTNAKTRLT